MIESYGPVNVDAPLGTAAVAYEQPAITSTSYIPGPIPAQSMPPGTIAGPVLTTTSFPPVATKTEYKSVAPVEYINGPVEYINGPVGYTKTEYKSVAPVEYINGPAGYTKTEYKSVAPVEYINGPVSYTKTEYKSVAPVESINAPISSVPLPVSPSSSGILRPSLKHKNVPGYQTIGANTYIQNSTYTSHEPGLCNCPLDHERINKAENDSNFLQNENSKLMGLINNLREDIDGLRKRNQLLKAQNGELQRKTMMIKEKYSQFVEDELRLREWGEDLKRERQELLLRISQMQFLLKEGHDHSAVREVVIPYGERWSRPTAVSKVENPLAYPSERNSKKMVFEGGYTSTGPGAYTSKRPAFEGGYTSIKPEGYTSKRPAFEGGYTSIKPEGYRSKRQAFEEGYTSIKPEGYTSKRPAFEEGYTSIKPEGYASQE